MHTQAQSLLASLGQPLLMQSALPGHCSQMTGAFKGGRTLPACWRGAVGSPGRSPAGCRSPRQPVGLRAGSDPAAGVFPASHRQRFHRPPSTPLLTACPAGSVHTPGPPVPPIQAPSDYATGSVCISWVQGTINSSCRYHDAKNA